MEMRPKQPLLFIAGPCVIESEDLSAVFGELANSRGAEVADRLQVEFRQSQPDERRQFSRAGVGEGARNSGESPPGHRAADYDGCA